MRFRSTVEADEAVFTPRGVPGVADDPVVHVEASVEAVANHLDTVVKLRSGRVVGQITSVENTTIIIQEWNRGDDDGEGTVHEGSHGGLGVVATNLSVAVEVGEPSDVAGGLAFEVLTEVRDVGPHPFFSDALVGGDVVVDQLVGTTLATTGATALVRVGGARSSLLLSENIEFASKKGVVGFHCLRACMGVAGTALTLIFNGSEDGGGVCAVVDGVGEDSSRVSLQNLGWLGLSGTADGMEVAVEGRLQFFISTIRELIDTLGPRLAELVVSDGFITALVEDLTAEGVFLFGAAVEAEVTDVLFVRVVLGEGVTAGTSGGSEGEGNGENHSDDGKDAERATRSSGENGGHFFFFKDEEKKYFFR